MKYFIHFAFALLFMSLLAGSIEARKEKGDPLNDPVSKEGGIVLYPTTRGS